MLLTRVPQKSRHNGVTPNYGRITHRVVSLRGTHTHISCKHSFIIDYIVSLNLRHITLNIQRGQKAGTAGRLNKKDSFGPVPLGVPNHLYNNAKKKENREKSW